MFDSECVPIGWAFGCVRFDGRIAYPRRHYD